MPAEVTRQSLHDPHFRVVDETPDYIVVDKPSHLLIHPSTPGNPPTLWDGLRGLLAFEIANGGRISIINRHDRETSGLVLVAKNRESARFFGIAMQQRRVRKEYFALVWGWPELDEFEVDAPLRRKGEVTPSPVWVRQIVDPGGAAARTRFKVLERIEAATTNGSRFSLLCCRPLTGRMHQIRVHLAHLGHAIVGDKIYGPDESCYLDFIETGWSPRLASRLLLPRQALHSSALEIPGTGGELLRWTSPPPGDFTLPGMPKNLSSAEDVSWS
ncbi:MAG: RluA family pseudouridine synthase [Verrucomicrobiales bacterium]